jgi:tryptophan 2,3-dioxygenase
LNVETRAPPHFLSTSSFQDRSCGIKRLFPVEPLSTFPVSAAQTLAPATLWDGFCSVMERNGFPMPAEDPEARRASLVRLARDEGTYTELFAVAESLVTHDELIATWRLRHVLMVERQIGAKTGTGGSTGASYLRTTLDKRFYPELWDLRSYL